MGTYRFQYLLRDADNFKVHGEVVFEGGYSEATFDDLRFSPDDDFLPSLLGVPHLSFGDDKDRTHEQPHEPVDLLFSDDAPPPDAPPLTRLLDALQAAAARGWRPYGLYRAVLTIEVLADHSFDCDASDLLQTIVNDRAAGTAVCNFEAFGETAVDAKTMRALLRFRGEDPERFAPPRRPT